MFMHKHTLAEFSCTWANLTRLSFYTNKRTLNKRMLCNFWVDCAHTIGKQSTSNLIQRQFFALLSAIVLHVTLTMHGELQVASNLNVKHQETLTKVASILYREKASAIPYSPCIK